MQRTILFNKHIRLPVLIQEGKRYLSWKQKLYGCNVEMSVSPIGLEINATNDYTGSVSDLEILQRNRSFHKFAIKKSEVEKEIIDHGHLFNEFKHLWAVLFDKGYQGVQELLCRIPRRKNPFVLT